MARVYPTLGEDVERRLEGIKRLYEQDSGYFEDKRCPYKWLKNWMPGTGAGAVLDKVEIFSEDQTNGEAVDTVIGEVQNTIEEMNAVGESLRNDSDSSDKIAFLKAKTTMLERWTILKGKLIDMKNITEFQKVVVAVLEEVLTKDQQQDFKNRLKKAGLES